MTDKEYQQAIMNGTIVEALKFDKENQIFDKIQDKKIKKMIAKKEMKDFLEKKKKDKIEFDIRIKESRNEARRVVNFILQESGRKRLTAKELVYHKDGNAFNNEVYNLEVRIKTGIKTSPFIVYRLIVGGKTLIEANDEIKKRESDVECLRQFKESTAGV